MWASALWREQANWQPPSATPIPAAGSRWQVQAAGRRSPFHTQPWCARTHPEPLNPLDVGACAKLQTSGPSLTQVIRHPHCQNGPEMSSECGLFTVTYGSMQPPGGLDWGGIAPFSTGRGGFGACSTERRSGPARGQEGDATLPRFVQCTKGGPSSCRWPRCEAHNRGSPALCHFQLGCLVCRA